MARPVANMGALRPLLDLCAERLARHDSSIAATLATALRNLPDNAVLCDPVQNAVAPPLPDLTSASDPLLLQLGRDLPLLGWRAPGFGKLPTALTDHMAVNELIGPTGQIDHERVRFGFLLQGAHISYPDHNHAAEELYHVLHGRADWQVDGQSLGIQSEGQFVHHKPWQTHAMQTGRQSMLSMWGWAGDIGMKHYQLT